ncbi:MAG: hypothetical protein Q7V01_00445 [Vicinamibacterales bacterium]|nr:hypothetical protein [Vicinamibacterales bacterium]
MLIVAALAFFVSGFAALTYQVVWQRLLGLSLGSDVHSATITVAAFMAGLGLGSLAGGRLADRVSARWSLALFVLAEFAIAGFGVVSTGLYYDQFYTRFGDVSLGPASGGAVLFAGLLWPTFFMGLSLPLLARGLSVSLGRVANVVGTLYGFNTLGAATGALVATWILLPARGLEGATLLAALLNALVGVVTAAAVLSLAKPAGDAALPAAHTNDRLLPQRREDSLPYATLVVLSGVSGFVALSFEILWFRQLGVMLKSSAFTFGTMLAIYLAGIGAGSAIQSLWIHRVAQPVKWFVATQAGIAAYGGISAAVLLTGLGDWGIFDRLFSYFGSYEPMALAVGIDADHASTTRSRGTFLGLYFGLPAVLIGVPTLLMGMAFPLLQRAVQHDLEHVGRRLGAMLAGNIVGSTLGSLVTGLVILDRFGTARTLQWLVALGVVVPLIWTFGRRTGWRWHRRVGLAAAVVAAAAALVALVPSPHAFMAAIHGARESEIVVGEDASGTFALRIDPSTSTLKSVVFANGLGQGWIPFSNVHLALGALPAFIHPAPTDGLVIGLGSAGTIFGMAGRPSLTNLTCVEIVRSQLPTLRRFDERYSDAGLAAILRDPRVQHVYGDGRAFLAKSNRRYDIIETDALRPSSSYSGNLYSKEYFELLRWHLKPRGLAVSWSPTARTHDTFVKVFPYVLSFGHIVLGSNRPIPFDPEAVRRRIAETAVRDYYALAGARIDTLMAPFLDRVPLILTPSFDRTSIVDVNTDLFPRDEFASIAHLAAGVLGTGQE